MGLFSMANCQHPYLRSALWTNCLLLALSGASLSTHCLLTRLGSVALGCIPAECNPDQQTRVLLFRKPLQAICWKAHICSGVSACLVAWLSEPLFFALTWKAGRRAGRELTRTADDRSTS